MKIFKENIQFKLSYLNKWIIGECIMNLKKILMISIVVLAVIASFTIVSAGLLDFNTDTGQKNEQKILHGSIIDSLVTYEYGEETFEKTISHEHEKTVNQEKSLTITSNDPNANGTKISKRIMDYKGYIIINLTNMSDIEFKQVKKMLDDGYNLDLVLKVDEKSPAHSLSAMKNYNYTFNDKILNVTFKGEKHIEITNGEDKDFSSGSVPLESYTFYEAIGSKNTTLTGSYSK